MLCALVLLGISYCGLLYYHHTITGTDKGDGFVGMMLGLYICSHPTANALDLLFFEQGAWLRFSSRWLAALWLGLNTLVLVTGWFVIFVGTTRLVGRT
jgi:hypothetical protein